MDFLQTMPPYVYLIPAIAILGFGASPAIVSTAIVAFAPAVRLTSLGIRQVPTSHVEVGKAFGASPTQAVFAIPPALRLTNLGIKEVPSDQLEVGKAFGASPSQVIWKIQIPAALPSIMAGVNQCIMMSLSMVELNCTYVIAPREPMRVELLFSHDPISFFGGVNAADGRVQDYRHGNYQHSMTDKAFAFPFGKGSSGAGLVFGPGGEHLKEILSVWKA